MTAATQCGAARKQRMKKNKEWADMKLKQLLALTRPVSSGPQVNYYILDYNKITYKDCNDNSDSF